MSVAELAGVLVPIAVLAQLGQLGGGALYVRSLFMPLTFLFLAVQTAFDVANQALAASASGRGDRAGLLAGALSMARVWVGVGVVVAGLLIAGAPLLADLLSVRAGARGDFEWFVRWMSLGALGLIWPVLCASTLRGAGRARAAAAITLISASVEVAGVAALGFGAGLGIWSVPLAMAGAALSGGLTGLALLRRAGLLAARTGCGAWRPEVTGQVLRVGVPVGISYAVLFGMNLALLWILGPFGPAVVSGFSAAITVQGLVYMPGLVLGSATAIVMNHRLGASRQAQLGVVLRAGLEAAAVVYLVFAVALWFGRDPLAHLLSASPPVAAQTAHFLGIVGLTYIVMGPVLTVLTAIEQVGGGFLATGLNGAYVLGVVVIGGILARRGHDPGALYVTMAVTNLAGLTAVASAGWYIGRRDRGAGTRER
jgi:Na+-driven multidrug efflux pump